MKKLANLLGVMGILLVVYCIAIRLAGQTIIKLDYVKTTPISVVIFAVFLMLIAMFIKLSSKKEVFIRRNIKILFWLSYIAIMVSLSIFLIISATKLSDQKVIERFRKVYYYTGTCNDTYYLGILSMQYPNDNWVMQEIISEIKPDFIIETGTASGGTTLFYATILEKVNENGKVITVDIKTPESKVFEFKTWRERVKFIKGDSVSSEVVDAIAERVKGHKVLVTLDSLHTKEHVLKELKLYSHLVSLNSYIVVQDTHFNGHPVMPGWGEGPWEAVEEFLKTNKDFKIDRSREKHLITQSPSGFLKRVR